MALDGFIEDTIMSRLNEYQKYEKMLELEDKKDIIKAIKQDILNSMTKISINELETVSYTIYIFCVLKAYGQKSEDIFEYGVYINQDSQKELFKFCKESNELEESDGKVYTDICQKYIKLISERIIKH